MTARTYHLETLGCPKNQVDSHKLEGLLTRDGFEPATDASDADLVVVNTCAFVEEARRESVDTILTLADLKRSDASLVVTGCLAERYGRELAEALPEADHVAGFGYLPTAVPGVSSDASAAAVPVSTVTSTPGLSTNSGTDRPSSAVPAAVPGVLSNGSPAAVPVVSSSVSLTAVPVDLGRRKVPDFDLLNLPRPVSRRPWAYVKIAEGCDRSCGFCAIPSFRGPQRSRSISAILDEVEALEASEIVLVAQDLASYGRDRGSVQIIKLVNAVASRVDRTRLLYLYPSALNDALVDAICATGVPYFDLSLQHVSASLLRRMRRWGSGDRFVQRINRIRQLEPNAAFRSNFIVGYPGETEADHDQLLRFLEEAQLDWCGFFAYSQESGTYSATLDNTVDDALRTERLAELSEVQDRITATRRDRLVGQTVEVLVDEPGIGRTHREAPEIDGVVLVPSELPWGAISTVTVTASLGCDLEAA